MKLAMLNVRIDNQVNERLKEMAEAAGENFSQHVRNILLEATVPVADEVGVSSGAELAPASMALAERKIFAMLHRILGHVLPDEGSDEDGDLANQLKLAGIYEAGFTAAYQQASYGFQTELSLYDCSRVTDILEMFRRLTYSIEELSKTDEPVSEALARSLEFSGFDHNDALEVHMSQYVSFLMEGSRWSELRPQLERHDGGNSRMPVLDMYSRMLVEYRRIVDQREPGYSRWVGLLSEEELEMIAFVQIHPENRRYFRSVTRFSDEAALIKMPSDAAIVASRKYEIRDVDRRTVLAREVTGREFLDAREQQLEAYLSQNPEHTNIAMVDVAELIKRHAV